MSAPLFTIVTATRNARAQLERTARSLAAQTFRDFEWIVVDGDSSDGTKALLPTLPHVTRFLSERDKGIADAWNKGLALATGDQVLILNAGDTYDPQMLAELSRVVDDKHVTCCHARLMSEDGREQGAFRSIPGRLWRGMHLAHNWCAVPRSAYAELGSYKLLPHAMDYEWFHRYYRRHGVHGFRVVDKILGTYFLGGHSDINAAAGFEANERIWLENGRSRWLARLLRLAYTAKHRRAMARRKA
jgi:glycosyltransferase involved in cell wall biosynthesis